MELDDLKTIWKEPAGENGSLESERQKIMTIISGSHRSILRSFTIDIIIGAGLNLAFLVVLVIFGSAVMPFLIKLIVATNLVSVPIYYRLYKSISYLKHLDFGRDIKANLENFLDYYRGALRFYKRATYFLISVLLLIFSLDNSFTELDLWIKVVIVAYLGIFIAVIRWFVDRLYGQRIDEIEAYLRNSQS